MVARAVFVEKCSVLLRDADELDVGTLKESTGGGERAAMKESADMTVRQTGNTDAQWRR